MPSFTPGQEAFNTFLGGQGYPSQTPFDFKYNFQPEGYSGMNFNQFNALRNSMGGFGQQQAPQLMRGQRPNIAPGPGAAPTNYAAMMGRPMGQAPNWAQMAQNFGGGFQARPMGGPAPMPTQAAGPERYGPGQYNPLQSQSPTPQASGGKAGRGGGGYGDPIYKGNTMGMDLGPMF